MDSAQNETQEALTQEILTQNETQEVLTQKITELTQNQDMAEINLGLDLTKAKQTFSNALALTSLKLKDAIFKELIAPQPNTAAHSEVADEENSESLSDSGSTKKEDRSTGYKIDLKQSPGIKTFIRITSIASLVQLFLVIVFFRLDFFGIHYRHSMVSSDSLWIASMMIFSSLMIKNSIFRKNSAVAFGLFLVDTLITGRGYIFGLYSPTYLTFMMVASISISSVLFILNEISRYLTGKGAFVLTFVVFAFTSSIAVIAAGSDFRDYSLFEIVAIICGFGYIAGLVAKERVRMFGRRLEDKERNISIGDCFAIGVGGNIRGLFRGVGGLLSKF